METIAIIPARGGSKRLPGKNLAMLGDRNLLEHSIAFAKANSTYIDAIIISTDNDKIADVARKNKVQVVQRPLALSDDRSPTVDALKHVLEQPEYSRVKTVVLLQPTNPLRPESLLDDAMKLWNEKKLDTLFTCSKLEQKFGSIQNNQFTPKNYSFGQRSQDLEPLYFENGLLYISSAESIKKGEMIAINHFSMIVDHEYAVIDIDQAKGLDFARYIWQKAKQS